MLHKPQPLSAINKETLVVVIYSIINQSSIDSFIYFMRLIYEIDL